MHERPPTPGASPENEQERELYPPEVVTNRLDDPQEIRRDNYRIVCGTDKGFGYSKEGNHDAAVIGEIETREGRAPVGLVADGFGERGNEAATMLAEAARDGFRKGQDFFEIRREAYKRIKERNLGEKSGTAHMLWKIEEGKFKALVGGDVQAKIMLENGEVSLIRGNNPPTPYDNEVFNVLTGKAEGEEGYKDKIFEIDLKGKPARALVHSDGVTNAIAPDDNVYNEEYWGILEKHINKVKREYEGNGVLLERSVHAALDVLDDVEGVARAKGIGRELRSLRRGLERDEGSEKLRRALWAADEKARQNEDSALLKAVHGKDAKEAVYHVAKTTQENMTTGGGKPDNRTLTIIDLPEGEEVRRAEQQGRAKQGPSEQQHETPINEMTNEKLVAEAEERVKRFDANRERAELERLIRSGSLLEELITEKEGGKDTFTERTKRNIEEPLNKEGVRNLVRMHEILREIHQRAEEESKDQ